MYLPNDSGFLVRRFGNTLQFLDHQKKSEEKYFFHRGEKLENILVAENFRAENFQDIHRKISKIEKVGFKLKFFGFSIDLSTCVSAAKLKIATGLYLLSNFWIFL